MKCGKVVNKTKMQYIYVKWEYIYIYVKSEQIAYYVLHKKCEPPLNQGELKKKHVFSVLVSLEVNFRSIQFCESTIFGFERLFEKLCVAADKIEKKFFL